jgi:hypothetical protein
LLIGSHERIERAHGPNAFPAAENCTNKIPSRIDQSTSAARIRRTSAALGSASRSSSRRARNRSSSRSRRRSSRGSELARIGRSRRLTGCWLTGERLCRKNRKTALAALRAARRVTVSYPWPVSRSAGSSSILRKCPVAAFRPSDRDKTKRVELGRDLDPHARRFPPMPLSLMNHKAIGGVDHAKIRLIPGAVG